MTVPEIAITVLIVLPMVAIWLFVLVDAIRREDLTAGRKIFWVLAALIVPLVAIVVYLVTRPRRSSPARAEVTTGVELRRRRPGSAGRAAVKPEASRAAQHGSMAGAADGSDPDHRTSRRRAGDAAEARVAEIPASTRLGHRRAAAASRSRRAGHRRARPWSAGDVGRGRGPQPPVAAIRSAGGAARRSQGPPSLPGHERAASRGLGAPVAPRMPSGIGWRVDLVAIDEGSGTARHLKGLIPR